MSTSKPNVFVRPLASDKASVREAARTVSLSFASDPLISWVMRDPTAPGWKSLDPRLQQWQEARLREYTCRSIMAEAVTDEDRPRQVGACFLFPPQPLRRWRIPSWWPVYLRVLWETYVVKPVEPLGEPHKIDIMMENHYAGSATVTDSYPPNSLYYLEIVCVRPDSQGLGVGGKLLRWIVEQVGDAPCYLECTDINNVPFYEKYGFKTVHEQQLRPDSGADPTCTLYYMVRDPKRKE